MCRFRVHAWPLVALLVATATLPNLARADDPAPAAPTPADAPQAPPADTPAAEGGAAPATDTPTPAPALRVDARAEAAAARAAGDHAAVAQALEAAYAEGCDPLLLREIARAHEAAGDKRAALAYWSRFITEAKQAPASARREASKKVVELDRGQAGAGDAPRPATVACGARVPLVAKYSQPTAAGAAITPATPDAGPAKTSTFAYGTHAGTLVEAFVATTGTGGAFHIGHSYGNVSIGVGLRVIGQSLAVTMGSNEDTEKAYVVQLVPGVRVTLARSADGRVEALGLLDVGFGTVIDDNADTSIVVWIWQLGPGVRYWIHPQFAIGAAFGLAGLSQTSADNAPNPDTTLVLTQWTTFGTLQVVGRF